MNLFKLFKQLIGLPNFDKDLVGIAQRKAWKLIRKRSYGITTELLFIAVMGLRRALSEPAIYHLDCKGVSTDKTEFVSP